MKNSDSVFSLCAKVDSAMLSAREALDVLASPNLGPRKRKAWRKELTARKARLDAASYALGMVLYVPRLASEILSTSERAHVETVHADGCRLLAILCDETPSF